MHTPLISISMLLMGHAAAWGISGVNTTSLLSPTTVSGSKPATSMWSTGRSSTTKDIATLTTYTTITTCPVTVTHSTGSSHSVYTTLTTSTVTITSCLGGCPKTTSYSESVSAGPTSYPITNTTTSAKTSKPSRLPPTGTGIASSPSVPHRTGLVSSTSHAGTGISTSKRLPTITSSAGPETITTTGPIPSATTLTAMGTTTIKSIVTSFVPQSTLMGTYGTSSYYSTFLTISYFPTNVISTTTNYVVVLPTSTAKAAAPETLGAMTSLLPVITPVPLTFPPSTVSGPVSGSCPPVQTVYSTIVFILTTTGPSSLPTVSGSSSGVPGPGISSPEGSVSVVGPPSSNGATTIYNTYTSTLPNGSTSTVVVPVISLTSSVMSFTTGGASASTSPKLPGSTTSTPGSTSMNTHFPPGTGSSTYTHSFETGSQSTVLPTESGSGGPALPSGTGTGSWYFATHSTNSTRIGPKPTKRWVVPLN